MADGLGCSNCGAPLRDGSGMGVCPACVLSAALEPADAGSPETSDAFRIEAVTASRTPDAIGPYKLLGRLGAGGMGEVYLAEQTQPLRRRAAVKIIKRGMDTEQVIARFESERQALAVMNHPNIACVFDAGEQDGRPYFAMEYVPGIPITEYCDRQRLTTRERLALFATVCHAVQHAHQKGIIHRDLKPSNVLVAVQDGQASPKVIDFGVAKATDQRLTERTLFTQHGLLVGTPEYMSPEQAELTGLDVDTRTDVYSLGVLLYELLVGALPFAADVLRRAGFDEMRRIIREEEPVKPTTRLSGLGETAAEIATRRQTDIKSLGRQIRGDLEWIALKALEKDKARRYSSAAELASDIRRNLDDEPIAARPPSATYQLRKFARRHKAVVTGMAAVCVVLVGGVAGSTWQAVRATEAESAAVEARDRALHAELLMAAERDQAREARNQAVDSKAEAQQERNKAVLEKQRADTEAVTARALYEFMGKDLLGMADPQRQARSAQAGLPDVIPNPDLTVREALDRAAGQISSKFGKQPLVEAALRETLAGIYRGLGVPTEAQTQLELAIAVRRREQGRDHRDTLTAMSDLASVHSTLSILSIAEAAWRDVVDGARRGLGDADPLTRHALVQLLGIYKRGTNTRSLTEAEALLTAMVHDERRTLGEDHPTTLTTIRLLIEVFESPNRMTPNQLRNYPGAEAFLIPLLAEQRRTLGDASPATLNSVNLLSHVYSAQGKYAEAEALLLGILKNQRARLGRTHAATLTTLNLLAGVYLNQGNLQASEALLLQVVPDTAVTDLLTGGQRGLEKHPTTLDSMRILAEVYAGMGKSAKAQALRENAVKVNQIAYGHGLRNQGGGADDIAQLLNTARSAGEYAQAGNDREAEKLAKEATKGYSRIMAAKDSTAGPLGIALVGVAREFVKQGKRHQADMLLAELWDVHRKASGIEHPDEAGAMAALGDAYRELRMHDEAEQILTSLFEMQQKRLNESHPDRLRTMELLALTYWEHAVSERDLGHSDRAGTMFTRAEGLVNAHLRASLSASRGEEQEDSYAIRKRLGQIYASRQEYKKAEEVFSNLRKIRQRPAGVGTGARFPWMRSLVTHLGHALHHQGKYAEAATTLIEMASFFDGPTRPEGQIRYNWEGLLGASLVAQRKYAEAEPRLLASYKGRTQPLSADLNREPAPPNAIVEPVLFTAREAVQWIVRLYDEWGRSEEAATWREKLRTLNVNQGAFAR